ncbi:MAG TPA: DNA adenine methylase [Pirellulaceae bacterium]|nr:DNA adenine methylase [Pirellulaceae bacterium]
MPSETMQSEAPDEDPEYLTRQLVTYLGNKRALLGPIGEGVRRIRERLGGRRLSAFDPFTGSGVVARFLKRHADRLIVNDLEPYAGVIARCFLSNRDEVDRVELERTIERIRRRCDERPFGPGIFERHYAPIDPQAIRADERVFYTPENARRLDDYRRALDECDRRTRELLLGPLLSRASIHANTAGVFKGFYKDRRTGVGRFGGSGQDALSRILAPIVLEPPVLSRFDSRVTVLEGDANRAAREIPEVDLCYVDPPYNQHPYGSNYFMLDLLVDYREPQRMSRVSGIPADWRRSEYNVRSRSLPLLEELFGSVPARFLLVSFSDEGFVAPETMRRLLEKFGSVERFEVRYNAFRGSRNFDHRPLHVTEQLFLVERR